MKEKRITYVEIEIELTQKTRNDLVEYAREEMTDEDLVKWAAEDILTKEVKECKL